MLINAAVYSLSPGLANNSEGHVNSPLLIGPCQVQAAFNIPFLTASSKCGMLLELSHFSKGISMNFEVTA